MIQTVLNTLFVQTQGAYLHLEQDTLRVEVEKELKLQIPLHHLGAIVVFGNVLVSPFLIHRCAQDGRDIAWFTEYGRFQARLQGPTSGNVLLRRAQYHAAANMDSTLYLARRFVEGKLQAAYFVLLRAARDYEEEKLSRAAVELKYSLKTLAATKDTEEVRGIEGAAAAKYFAVFPLLIRVSGFTFSGREKRPPRDPVNAALSFTYSVLVRDCQSALEAVGLDPQVGYLHALRPGRPALALDLMEEFRAPFADRVVLTLFNRQQLNESDFEERPGGAVFLNEAGRKTLLTTYQARKQETVHHPLSQSPVAIGLLPYLQARVLARYIRSDFNEYLPFRWR